MRRIVTRAEAEIVQGMRRGREGALIRTSESIETAAGGEEKRRWKRR
jgi:hypothetical protein